MNKTFRILFPVIIVAFLLVTQTHLLANQTVEPVANAAALVYRPPNAPPSAPLVQTVSNCLIGRGEECITPEVSFRCLGDPDDPEACGPMQGTITISDVLKGKRIQPPSATDTLFVVDRQPTLDSYKFGDELPNGILSFTIPISRVFFDFQGVPPLDQNGFLQPGISLTNMMNRQVIPPTANLTIAAFDVDSNAGKSAMKLIKCR